MLNWAGDTAHGSLCRGAVVGSSVVSSVNPKIRFPFSWCCSRSLAALFPFECPSRNILPTEGRLHFMGVVMAGTIQFEPVKPNIPDGLRVISQSASRATVEITADPVRSIPRLLAQIGFFFVLMMVAILGFSTVIAWIGMTLFGPFGAILFIPAALIVSVFVVIRARRWGLKGTTIDIIPASVTIGNRHYDRKLWKGFRLGKIMGFDQMRFAEIDIRYGDSDVAIGWRFPEATANEVINFLNELVMSVPATGSETSAQAFQSGKRDQMF